MATKTVAKKSAKKPAKKSASKPEKKATTKHSFGTCVPMGECQCQ